MMKRERVIAALFTGIAVLVMLSSSIFLIEHADHDCTGADCLICAQLYRCAQNLKSLAAAAAIVLSAGGFVVVSRVALYRKTHDGVSQTPVLLKVKLSN